MDRCALFVDAGYLLAEGAMAVHGTRDRDSVSWDHAALVQLLNEVARDRTGLPLLRCYWYEAVTDGRRSQEQEGIADIPGVKFRAARIRPGRREGVENYVQKDLIPLAQSRAICDAVLICGDEDMAPVVAEVQELGVRVTVVNISIEGNWTISRALRRECDDLIEIGAGHLRPHVNLLEAGAGPADDTIPSGQSGPLSNGRSRPNTGPSTRQPATAHPGASRVEPAAATMEAMFAATGAQPAASGSAMEQLRAMRQSLAQQRGDHLAAQNASAMEPRTGGQPSLNPGSYPHQHGTGAHPGMAGMGGSAPTGAQPSHAAPQTGAHPSMRPQGYPPQGQGQSNQHQAPPRDPRDPMVGGSYEREAPPPAREIPPDPRYGNTGENPGFGGNTGPNPTFGASTGADSRYRSAQRTRQGFESAAGPRPQNNQTHQGAYTDPAPRLGYHPSGGRTIEEAVAVAHREGNDFAESIARDAPVLWLEAVLARKPRMPSDLEARLLQGSALPVDFLLRDEVRHALRQGFWDALERSRT
ncbi:NYN domain-containing protein [Thermobifida halotolerans]|uniref:NYN domain-containing protein n=1 Tax=Thermobifida halotolerans TaxID=483545 RepID=A0A399G0S2_9ACTN|nr:NYN domain-containing protein [Thermobifida halotolerans]UOE18792.1 NYN domain-containing protein [Thermobifida halotolerans]